MKSTFAARLIFALLLFTAAVRAEEKPAPNARFGNVLYQTPDPKVWTPRQSGNRMIFAADLPVPDFAEMTVFRGGALQGDFKQTFDAAANMLLKERGVVKIERDSGVQQSSSAEGFPVLQRTLYCEAKDFHTMHWFLAGNSGGRFDMISFETSGEEGWNAHIAEGTNFFMSVKLANSLSPDKIPAPLRNVESTPAKPQAAAGKPAGGRPVAAPVTATTPAAQPLQAGSKVEGYQASSAKWLPGTLAEVETNHDHRGPYHVVYDDKKLVFPDDWLLASEVRPAGQFTNIFRAGAKVDVMSKMDRGTVIAVKGFDYKIHFDGCKAYWDGWYDGSDLKPSAPLSTSSADVKFLLGAWKMFQPSAPNTVIKGGEVYREYGFGAKAPPLQIRADGTYIWKEDFDAPATRGKWYASSRIPSRMESGRKVKSSAYELNGIVIKARDGQLWRLYRATYQGKPSNGITLDCLCSGLEMMGRRG
jgi:hypothetical protein